MSAKNVRDALNVAWSMLSVIEHGGAYDTKVWDERMARIERALGEDTPRARHLPPAATEEV